MPEQNKDAAGSGEQGGSSAPAKPRVRKAPQKNPPKLLPPWKVLLHNDDVHSMDEVIEAIRQLTPLNRQDAEARMTEAHKTGVALLLVTHKERAELYVEQFATKGLTATCEADA